MHCITGDVVTSVLLLNWVGIYLYLVIANKILTNFKSNAQLQPSSLVSVTLHELPPLASSCTLFPTTCWAMNVCELTLAVSHPPTGQEQVPQDEALGGCCDVFVRGLGRRLPVNFGLLDRCLLICNYLFCIELLLYSKVVTFDPVPWFIICVRLGPSTPGDYVRARVLVPLKPGCDRSGIRGMLTVGWNLDITGQPLSTYLCYSNSF